ncbi:MAG: VTT domain-containing protein [Chloroflexota bacterium]
MNNSCDRDKPNTKGWLRRNIIPLLIVCFVVSLSFAIFCFYRRDPGRFDALKAYGYLGAFLISLLFNATVILPVGNVLVLAALGAILPVPLFVGLTAAAGATIGELSGYIVGYSGHKILERSRMYNRVEDWVKKWASLTIFVMSLFPLIFDLAGLTAGALRFPLWKFMFFCWLGRTIFYIGIAYAGVWGWEALLHFLG